MQSVKKIDIHAHATAFPEYFPPCRNDDRFVSAGEVIDFYDRLNIEKGVLLPISAPEAQITPMTSEATKYIVDKYPDRFLWFCGVDPRAVSNSSTANLSRLINCYKEMGAKGVGELTAHLYADDPMVDNLFSCCEECDMPVTIHISPMLGESYGIVDELGLPRLEKMLKKHPKLKVLGHSQPFWAEMSADVNAENRRFYPEGKVKEGRIAKLMREYENLYCDLSANSGMNALMRDPEFAAKFVEEFSDRLLYGCDICAPTNVHPFEMDAFLDQMVADGYISMDNYCKMVRGNAIKLLKLED